MQYNMYCTLPLFFLGMILRFDWLCEGLDLWWLSKATRRFNDFFVRESQAQIVSFCLSPMRKKCLAVRERFSQLVGSRLYQSILRGEDHLLTTGRCWWFRNSWEETALRKLWWVSFDLVAGSWHWNHWKVGSNFSTGPNPSEWWKYRNFFFLLSSGHKERCGHARTRGRKLWWFFVHWKCGNPNLGNHFFWGIQIHWEFRHTQKNEKEPREKWCLPVICYANCSQFFILRGKPAIHWTLAAVGSVQRFRSNSSE